MDVATMLLEPLSYGFMQRGMIAALLVATVCAVLSCYLVLKGWALMGDAISHAVLPGIVLAWLTGLPFALGAFGAGLSCALFTGYIKNRSRIKEDTVMGIVFSGMFALGVVMISKIETDIHLMHILFGNILGISWADIFEIALIAGITLVVIALKWRDFMLYCFDPAYGKATGLHIGRLHFGLLILLALTIVSALKTVGIILVIAMLIAPGATALLLTERFSMMITLAVIIALISSLGGFVSGFYLDLAIAPMIVLIQAGLFMLVFWRYQWRESNNRRRAATAAAV